MKNDTKPKVKVSCKECHFEIERFVWNKRLAKMIECTLCLQCWKKANPKRNKYSRDAGKGEEHREKDETSALLIGGIENNSRRRGGKSNRKQAQEVILDHHIFDSQQGWKKSESIGPSHIMFTPYNGGRRL